MFFIILFGAFLLDQISKYIAYMFLQPQGVIPVVNNAFYLNYVEDFSTAFGAAQNNVWILISLTIIIVCIGGYYIYKAPYISNLSKYSIALLTGGVLGNFFDAIRLGFVIDFFDFIILPVFNLADIFVTAGAFMLVWVVLLGKDRCSRF